MQLHDAQLVPGLAEPNTPANSGAAAGPADLCEVLDAARIDFLSTLLSFMHESVEPDPPPPESHHPAEM